MAKSKVKITESINEIWKELFERSVWPTREEVFSKTIVVIVLLAIIATILGFIDYFITFLTRILLQGKFVSMLFSSKITLFVMLGAAFLLVVYFAINYVRKNRYNR